ncbi:MAG TPA: hypothetical protein VL574_08165 [Stellaceae bacterium]|nr:hypothetical protein [Stellaceae bacterium]
MMRTSQTLGALVGRLRAAGMEEEAALLESEAARVRGIEAVLEAVVDGMSEPPGMVEPIAFPARRVPGLWQHAEARALAAD